MKDFLLLSSINAITYKDFFPLLKERKVSMGVEMPKEYDMPDGTIKKFGNICWYTTLHTPDKKKLVLTKKYKHTEYPHYDNYNAINVNKVKDIPYDYDCVMGVPITIFQYDLDNVEIMKDQQPERLIRKKIVIMGEEVIHNNDTKINGKERYRRVCIRLARR